MIPRLELGCTGLFIAWRSRTNQEWRHAYHREWSCRRKNVPILLAAIAAKCTHLLTGDRKHFGPHFGRSIEGVRVMMVRDYLIARDVR